MGTLIFLGLFLIFITVLTVIDNPPTTTPTDFRKLLIPLVSGTSLIAIIKIVLRWNRII